ncbi:hypothetical protein Tco_1016842 [Tanacetum coccineum]|uniref:Uncharacterized protein n=1 Tax=Tanacetum coccineum TaxID=301880 RepID=A0ABQ5FSD1_9ASTR
METSTAASQLSRGGCVVRSAGHASGGGCDDVDGDSEVGVAKVVGGCGMVVDRNPVAGDGIDDHNEREDEVVRWLEVGDGDRNSQGYGWLIFKLCIFEALFSVRGNLDVGSFRKIVVVAIELGEIEFSVKINKGCTDAEFKKIRNKQEGSGVKVMDSMENDRFRLVQNRKKKDVLRSEITVGAGGESLCVSFIVEIDIADENVFLHNLAKIDEDDDTIEDLEVDESIDT